MSVDFSNVHEYSVAIPEPLHAVLADHLLQHLRAESLQEDLCFAVWRPSEASGRFTALLFDSVLPMEEERILSGNVSFTAAYLERAARIAAERKAGLALLHSH